MIETHNKESDEPKFNKIQSVLWPVHGYELKKFVPISLLMFCILFVYTMVKDLKDNFIQNFAICGGTELIPVLKLWFVMPAAFLVVILFSYLMDKFGSKKTFYIIISMFMSFYLIFLFFLFPNAKYIHASAENVIAMQKAAPGMFYYIIPCITNWSYTLFYVISELWGTLTISSLFWQFANQITKKSEVKRFFGLYALIGDIGVFLSGKTLESMSKVKGEAFNRNVSILIGTCIFFCIATMGVYYYINNYIMTDPKFYDPPKSEEKTYKNKPKTGIMDGIKLLFTSPYLMLIAVLVIAYGVSINFLEVVWKAQMKSAIPDANEYSAMTGRLSQFTAIFTITATLLSTNILRRFSWKTGAIITPIIMLIFGGIFFILMIYNKMGGKTLFGTSVPFLAVWIGLLADSLIKSVKYCLFDSTKNMAYLPLDKDTKTKGQAAVEVIGGRAGKAGASTVVYVLTNMVSVGSRVTAHLGVIIALFSVTVFGWIASVLGLNKKYLKKISNSNNK